MNDCVPTKVREALQRHGALAAGEVVGIAEKQGVLVICGPCQNFGRACQNLAPSAIRNLAVKPGSLDLVLRAKQRQPIAFAAANLHNGRTRGANIQRALIRDGPGKSMGLVCSLSFEKVVAAPFWQVRPAYIRVI